MAKMRPPVALIAGPTASGKSALALGWRKRRAVR
jgi:tRNA A37 N6-isopentenylltransferase MiaA